MSEINRLTKRETFEEVILSKKPIVVKFYADWCPDCKRLDIMLIDLIDDFDDISWYEVNSDELKGIAETYGIMGLPSILIFKEGKKIAHLSNAQTKTSQLIRTFLQNEL